MSAQGESSSTSSTELLAGDAVVAGLEPLAAALGASMVGPDQMNDGDLPFEVDGHLIAGMRLDGIQGALDRLIAQVERETGSAVTELDREGKQAAVRRLDELGAFGLRKAVEDIADRLGVSRFTVYNYLNAQF